jgi:peroxiredoxin
MSQPPHGPARGERTAGTIEVGDLAPSFRLRRTFEESVGLEDLTEAGPVLLLFYVFDFGAV